MAEAFDKIQSAIMADAEKSNKLEKRIALHNGGYQQRAKMLRQKIVEASEALEKEKISLDTYRTIQIAEEAALPRRLEALREEYMFVQKREREAQEVYRNRVEELAGMGTGLVNGSNQVVDGSRKEAASKAACVTNRLHSIQNPPPFPPGHKWRDFYHHSGSQRQHTMHPYIAVPATLALVWRAYSRDSLTPAGIVVAALTAVVHAIHPWSVFFALLVVFFLAGTAVTKVYYTTLEPEVQLSDRVPG
ncbi:MAG: hypothetical protein L6R42_011298 [Xanthoria sp. 1 TBL-2021]|nr:MAG: hypothetical protein L6R42_011298 [Xanthoria sp. 1 TBL-2021]